MTDLLTERQALEKDFNAGLKQLLSLMEAAARTPPIIACAPYAADERRKRTIRIVWGLYKRLTQAARDGLFAEL